MPSFVSRHHGDKVSGNIQGQKSFTQPIIHTTHGYHIPRDFLQTTCRDSLLDQLSTTWIVDVDTRAPALLLISFILVPRGPTQDCIAHVIVVIESIRQLFRHDCIGVSKPVENIIPRLDRSEDHTPELQSLMRISYAVFCLKKKTKKHTRNIKNIQLKS